MRNKTSETINIYKNSTMQQLLTALLAVVLVFFINSLNNDLNVRKDSGITYNSENHYFEFPTNKEFEDSLYIGKNWIFVPNVTSSAVRNQAFVYESYITYPHAINASISSLSGWRDLGDDAVWVNTSDAPAFRTYTIDNQNYSSGLYLMKAKLPQNIQSVNISIPKIYGNADLYCNGNFMGPIGYDDKKAGIQPEGGYNNTTLTADSEGNLEIIVAVRANSIIYCPGMTSYPQFSLTNTSSKSEAISISWIIIELFITSLTLTAGLVISSTFTDRRKYWIFIGIQFCFMIYTLTDCDVLVTNSLEKLIIKYAFSLLSAVHLYAFIGSLFVNSKANRKYKHLNYDRFIIAAIAIILMLILYLDKQLFSTDFTQISIFIFSCGICLTCIFNTLFFYINHKNAAIGLSASIIAFFCFLNMQYSEMYIYNIPTYSVYAIVALIALDVYFMSLYNKQYKELQSITAHLQNMVNEKTIHISEINRDLMNTNKRLLANEEARKNVLSNVSHDLRTPITAIKGYADLMLASGTKLGDEQREIYLGNIVKRAAQMENLVTDIVELTKMESGTSEFIFLDLSLTELLEEQRNIYNGELATTNKKLIIDVPEDDLLISRADARKFSRVIENLISNAINYTNDDGVITVKAWRSNTELPLTHQKINITISDNGIGIPEDNLPHIFDRFYRASNSGKNIKGTGLGLSIVKTIIDHHDATIDVTSVLNEGTTFHIVMPAS